MNLPEPQHKQFAILMADIKDGRLKIPQFQRDFVWDIKKSANLLDSIVKGYPVGTFIFWKTKERLRSVKNLGNLSLPDPPKGDYVNFVLDGQQRITSLFAALEGLKIRRSDGTTEDFSEMYIDLEAKDDEKIVTTEIEEKERSQLIKLRNLLYGSISELSKYPKKYEQKLDEYKNRINAYNYSVIQVNDVPIDVATEIFTRINVGGVPLETFEIMVAKTYDLERKFDLYEQFNSLKERLRDVNYETLSRATPLQLVSLILTGECKKKVILGLDKEKFIETWPKAAEAIEGAVDYFKSYFRIPVSSLLPYNALLVPFGYFFYHHNDKPIGKKQKYLEDFFWRVSLAGRYSSSQESRLAQDIRHIDTILKDELPKYDWPVDTSPQFIKNNGWFSAGRSYVKAILCIYAYHQPKSFADDSLVIISNDWLKQANSKNYHHFFPKAYMEKTGEKDGFTNNILNITIVDDFLNKRQIKDKPPSKYMAKFKEINRDLSKTMQTHLINDLREFGVWTDNFGLFLDKRAEAVSKEIRKRIIKQEIDGTQQHELLDDASEENELGNVL